MKTSNILFLFIFTLSISSCVGGGVIYPGEKRAMESPSVSSIKGRYSSSQNQKNNLTCQNIQEKWGAPDNIELIEDLEVLTYKNGLVWAGVLPFIVIPIPMAIPIGQETTIIECKNNIAIRAYGTETKTKQAYCGVISTKFEYGCDTD